MSNSFTEKGWLWTTKLSYDAKIMSDWSKSVQISALWNPHHKIDFENSQDLFSNWKPADFDSSGQLSEKKFLLKIGLLCPMIPPLQTRPRCQRWARYFCWSCSGTIFSPACLELARALSVNVRANGWRSVSVSVWSSALLPAAEGVSVCLCHKSSCFFLSS